MDKVYYSVAQIARILHMHPKTIQRYIREGKLRAVKIGKSWRISGHDLSRFTEENSLSPDQAQTTFKPQERAKASAVIDITTGSEADAQRMIRSLNAAMLSRPPEFVQVSLVTQYLEADSTVRVSLWGNLPFMAAVFSMVETYMKQVEEEAL